MEWAICRIRRREKFVGNPVFPSPPTAGVPQELFKNGVFFDKKGTVFLLTEKNLCAIMSIVEKYGRKFSSASAANGSCRNKCRPISRFLLTAIGMTEWEKGISAHRTGRCPEGCLCRAAMTDGGGFMAFSGSENAGDAPSASGSARYNFIFLYFFRRK